MFARRQSFKRRINQYALRGLRKIDRADLLAFGIFHDNGRGLCGAGKCRTKKRNGSRKPMPAYFWIIIVLLPVSLIAKHTVTKR